MNYQEYVKPELLILIPVLYIIGMLIKDSGAKSKNIPWVLGVCGVLLAAIYLFSVEPINGAQAIATALFTAITQGVLTAGASVYVNQLIKQAKKEE